MARPGVVDTLTTGIVVLCGAPLLAASLVSELRWPVDETSRLAKAQQMGRRALSLLGVELECLGAERIPREGGLVFMWNQMLRQQAYQAELQIELAPSLAERS
ncbi:MAG: hypothetical protein LC098_12195 [Burkholderiales bacterium]|nr:hypothetical protein [Burkholderiales bacterium]